MHSNCSSGGAVRPEISIIVPVYQVEAYLPDCLDSILRQSFTDWEMLLVDDGSRDAGGEICDSYAARDERIRVFHQQNAGLSAARNTGLDHARGEYLVMVDSDDVLAHRDFLRILYDAIRSNDAQISCCGLLAFHDGDPIPDPWGRPSPIAVFSGEEACRWKDLPAGYFFGSAHCKMYHRDLFRDLRYPVGQYAEDNAVAHRLMLPCRRVVVTGMRMYGYRVRPGSIMTSASRQKMIQDVILAFTDRIDYYRENKKDALARFAERQLFAHIRFHQQTEERWNSAQDNSLE